MKLMRVLLFALFPAQDDRTERHNKVVVRKTVSVMPVNGNWGESYKEDVEKMVAARALAKARLLLR